MAVVEIENLCTHFFTDEGVVQAVNNVSFRIEQGQTFALVGESGCGKSVTASSLMRLVPTPPAKITADRMLFNGQQILPLSEKQMRSIRGKQMSMIFQEPMTSLNPVFTIGFQLVEVLQLHRGLSDAQARTEAIALLEQVGIDQPAQRFSHYPHQLSGGMRQRVMIAMALSCRPQLLIADEPTTALDVTIQRQILELLKQLQHEYGMAMLFITHDLGVVYEIADEVAVMYASHIVEQAPKNVLFSHAAHPYTQGLLASIPRLGDRRSRLPTIDGAVASAAALPPGCPFHPRCSLAAHHADATEKVPSQCMQQLPQLTPLSSEHRCACHFAQEAGS